MDTENTRIKIYDTFASNKDDVTLHSSNGIEMIDEDAYKEFQNDDVGSMSDASSDSETTSNALLNDDKSMNTSTAATAFSSGKQKNIEAEQYGDDESMGENTDINSVSVDASDGELEEEEIDEDEKFINEFLCFDKNTDTHDSVDQVKNTGKYSFDQESKEVRGRPSACVFVASLSSNLDDDVLCQSVTNHFKQWGEMKLVKVLRDPANRPYAFVQYARDEDADKAITEGQHSILNGRTVRCEKARVNRTLYLQLSNDGISEKLIKKLMARFGEIERLVAVNDNFNAIKSSSPNLLHKNWFCKFVYRQDAISAFANLKTKANWNIEWAQNLDDEYSNVPDVTIDKHSIFVGHLDPRISKEELIERFEKHGKVKEAILVNRPLSNFAFIKFRTREAAASAVERENHSLFNQKTIHVQYREMYNNYRRKLSDKGLKLNLAPPPVNFKKRFNADPRPNNLQNIRNYHGNYHGGFQSNHLRAGPFSSYRGRNNSYSEDFTKMGAPETYSQAFKMKHSFALRNNGRFPFGQYLSPETNIKQANFTDQRTDTPGDISMRDAESEDAGTSIDDNDSSIEIKIDDTGLGGPSDGHELQSHIDENTESKKSNASKSQMHEIKLDNGNNSGKHDAPIDQDASTMRSNATFSSAGPQTGYTYSSVDNESEVVNMQMAGPPINGAAYQYPYYYYYPPKDMPYMNPPMHQMNPAEHAVPVPPSAPSGPYYYPYGNYPPPSTPNGQMPVYPMYVYYKPVAPLDQNGEMIPDNTPQEFHPHEVV